MKELFNLETLRNILAIVLFALIFSFSYNFFSPEGLNIFEKPSDVLSKNVDSKHEEFNVASIEETQILLSQGNAILIDARSSSDYLKEHLPGAINIPTKEFDNYIDRVFNLPQDKLLIIYCEGIHCNLSHELANKLKTFGFTNITLMVEGIEGWKRRNLLLEK